MTYEELRSQIARAQGERKIAKETARHPKAYDKYEHMHMKQLEHAKNQIEICENKTASIHHRKKFLERQNNANYRLEHDRIHSALKHNVVPDQTVERLQKREVELHKLFNSHMGNDHT